MSFFRTTVENGDTMWMSDWYLRVVCRSYPQCRSAEFNGRVWTKTACTAPHASMTSPSLPPSYLSCLFSLSHPLHSPVPLSSPSPTLSFFLKLWHHLVWDVVAVLVFASRWQPWLIERALWWKKKYTLQYQDEVILLKNTLRFLIHSFKSVNFQSSKATHDMIINGNKVKRLTLLFTLISTSI